MPYLSELERGRKGASSEVLAAICDALAVDLSDLLTEVGRGARRQTEPREEPNCSGQFAAYLTGSKPAASASLVRGLHASLSGRGEADVVPARRQRDRRLDRPPQPGTVTGQVVAVLLGPDGQHPATDVDPDRRRHGCAEGGAHRADRGALAR